MRIVFLTYGTEAFQATASVLASSARAVGFDQAYVTTQTEVMNTEFGTRNRDVLMMPRGGGYWLWKPYIIDRALRQANPDDVIFYCDAGRTTYYGFTSFPKLLIDRVRGERQGVILGPAIPHLGTIGQWTKRDCLTIMGADPEFISRALIISGWNLWRPTARAFEVLRLWLQYCENKLCLTDEPNKCGLPNYDDFCDHRHDQSILSVLAHMEGIPFLDFTRTTVHRLIESRPRSALGHTFYKRPQNSNDLLCSDNPYLLAREYFRLRNCEKQ